MIAIGDALRPELAERGLMRSRFADVALNGCSKCRILIR